MIASIARPGAMIAARDGSRLAVATSDGRGLAIAAPGDPCRAIGMLGALSAS